VLQTAVRTPLHYLSRVSSKGVDTMLLLGIEPGACAFNHEQPVTMSVRLESLGAVMGVEPIARAYETQCVTGRTPQNSPVLGLVEGDGIEPSLPAYQTGVLPLNEPSSSSSVSEAVARGGIVFGDNALVSAAGVEPATFSL
jgi:hypothetical protein